DRHQCVPRHGRVSVDGCRPRKLFPRARGRPRRPDGRAARRVTPVRVAVRVSLAAGSAAVYLSSVLTLLGRGPQSKSLETAETASAMKTGASTNTDTRAPPKQSRVPTRQARASIKQARLRESGSRRRKPSPRHPQKIPRPRKRGVDEQKN